VIAYEGNERSKANVETRAREQLDLSVSNTFTSLKRTSVTGSENGSKSPTNGNTTPRKSESSSTG
jgi:hypothetical protein